MSKTVRRDRGFTLIELLVVISVTAILIGLILPAIQQARETARKTACQNNLKQLGLALHNYHGLHQLLPPGHIQYMPQSRHRTAWWSWVVCILPHMEQNQLHDRLDLNLHAFWGDGPLVNGDACATIIPTLVCSSNPHGTKVFEESPHRFAHSAYLGITGSEAEWDGNGMFPDRNVSVRFSEVSDGMSQTLILGERPFDIPRRYYGWWAAGAGSRWPPFGRGDNVLDSSEGLKKGDPAVHNDLFHWYSFHREGANFLVVDGSVRFFTYSMDGNTLRSLSSKDEGEVVGDF